MKLPITKQRFYGCQKRISLLAALTIFALLIAACGDTATPPSSAGSSITDATQQASGQMVELTFAMNNIPFEVPGWTAQVEAANKLLATKNIRIKIESVETHENWTDYYQKVTTLQAAGKAPDIARAAESLLPVLINKNQLLDITSTVKELDMTKFFEKTFQGSSYKNGKYYGIPSGVYYMLLYYNKDLFDKAGLSYPSTDWNKSISLQQIQETARKLTAGSGPSKTFGLTAGPYMSFVGMYSVSNGGKNIFNDNGTCAMNEAPNREVYKWFDTMLHTDYSMPLPDDLKDATALDLFKSGRIAIDIDGTWAQQPVKNDIKNFRAGIAAVPSGKGKAYSSMFVDAWVIMKGSKYEKEAREALKALNSTEAISALAAKGAGGIPIRRDVLETHKDELIGAQFSPDDKAAFIAGLDHTLPVPYNERYQEIDDKVNQAMTPWLRSQITVDSYVNTVCDIINMK